jgi:hypothetical protein
MPEHDDGEFLERERQSDDILPGEEYSEQRERLLRRIPAGGASKGPPGEAPGREQSVPFGGRFFTKRGVHRSGRAGARTGGIEPPVALAKGAYPVYDEKHPLPVQLPRECWDYFFNLMRQSMVHIEQPPWIEPPLRSTSIDSFAQQAGSVIAPGATASVIAGGGSIPRGEIGYIVRMGQGATIPADFSFLTWRIVKNGVPVQPYATIGLQLGEIVNPSKLANAIQLRPGDTFDFQATNTGPAPITAFGRLVGWRFPVQVLTDGSFRENIVD